MSEFHFGIITVKPTVAQAKQMERICKAEGGHGFVEVNRRRGEAPGINNREYMGWFAAPNRGNPFDDRLAARVKARILAEIPGVAGIAKWAA